MKPLTDNEKHEAFLPKHFQNNRIVKPEAVNAATEFDATVDRCATNDDSSSM